ncbi:MAG: hypothetical protein IT323_22585 [Anaerolineae bacterium]|nr:hypothetical protein [Anaerolineae bacterium]
MAAPRYIQKIEVFISSPSDVAPEREAAARVIERLNRLSSIRERAYLSLAAYEKDAPPVVDGSSAQAVVDRYMMRAEHSDLLVCVFWSRMGTPVKHPETGEQFESGAEYEFVSSYRANLLNGKPFILLYRKVPPNPDADPEQKAKVDAFFSRFEGDKPDFRGLYRAYQSLDAFEEMLFEHIERIVMNNLLKRPAQIPAQERPQFVEETRRLDAAMPGQTRVERPTELWVQVCLPSSEGFRPNLPAFTRTRREQITERDVRTGGLAVAFPVDKATGEPGPVLVTVEIRAPDFKIEESSQEVLLWARADSGLLVFNLTPARTAERSIVHVTVKQTMPEGPVITLGSASLATQITGAGLAQAAAQVAWTLLSLPLTAVELVSPSRSMALEASAPVFPPPSAPMEPPAPAPAGPSPAAPPAPKRGAATARERTASSADRAAASDHVAAPKPEAPPQPILRQIAAKRAEQQAARRRSRSRMVLQILVALILVVAGLFGGPNGRILLGLGLIALALTGAWMIWNVTRHS